MSVGPRDVWAVIKASAEKRLGKPLLRAYSFLAVFGAVVVAACIVADYHAAARRHRIGALCSARRAAAGAPANAIAGAVVLDPSAPTPSAADRSSRSAARTALGTVTFEVATPCASVFLIQNGTDRRALPSDLNRLQLDPLQTWSLEAVRTHHRPYVQPISFEDGLEKHYIVRLEPEPDFDPRRDVCPPSPSPQLWPWPPEEVVTCLTASQVLAVLARHKVEVRRCWFLTSSPEGGAKTRRVALSLRVGPDGGVLDALANGDDPRAARCIKEHAVKWNFPAGGCIQQLTVPFVSADERDL